MESWFTRCKTRSILDFTIPKINMKIKIVNVITSVWLINTYRWNYGCLYIPIQEKSKFFFMDNFSFRILVYKIITSFAYEIYITRKGNRWLQETCVV